MICRGRKTNILVTGGMGFIGSHLVDLLHYYDNNIIIVDNMESNAVSLEYSSQKSQVFVQSIEDFNFDRVSFDYLFHLASPVGPIGVLNYAGDMAKRIIDDTVKVRDACIEKNAPLIFISSSEIYGHAGELSEDAVKIFPSNYSVRSEYGAAKMLAEMAIINKAKVTDLKYLIIRPFNVAGPRQLPDNGFVLPRFILQALDDEALTVYGDGTQRRAFTDVRDIVSLISLLTGDNCWGEIYNIGNPRNEMSIKDLAWKVLEIFSKMNIATSSEIMYVDPKTIHGPLFEEVPDKIPYIEKLNKFGFKMGHELETTIIDAIKYMIDFGV